ncbi:MAG: hypothetical protein KDD60_00760, partial [Bdellovibrionales bacterium]|nr:hypothetical protein [Bdellovibrionales bacterium]
MSKADASQSLKQLWENCLSERADDPYVKVAKALQTRVQRYSFTSFEKRASRAGAAFQTALKLAPGARIALCVDDPDDFGIILHGALLAGLHVFPVPSQTPVHVLMKAFAVIRPVAFIFPPSFSASLAGFLPHAPTIEHWIVTGKDTERKESSGGIQTFDGVMQSVAGEGIRRDESDSAALLSMMGINGVPTESDSGSQDARVLSLDMLLQTARTIAECLGVSASEQDVWISHDYATILGIVHNFFLPLISYCPALIRPGVDMKDFWRQMLSDEVSLAIVNYDEFADLEKKGKARDWRRSEGFQILICDQSRFDIDLIEEFTERFNLDVGTAFVLPEVGAYVAFRHPTDLDIEYLEDETEQTVGSYGRLVVTAVVRPKALPGLHSEDNEDQWGDLLVSIPNGKSPLSLDTGIRSCLLEVPGPGGEPLHELFVVGRSAELVV